MQWSAFQSLGSAICNAQLFATNVSSDIGLFDKNYVILLAHAWYTSDEDVETYNWIVSEVDIFLSDQISIKKIDREDNLFRR